MQMGLLQLIAERMASDPQGAKTVLIDADRIPYLAALKADLADVSPDDVEPITLSTLRQFEAQLLKALDLTQTPASEFPLFMYFYSTPSFRHQICSEYKSNRRRAWAPIQRTACVEAIKSLRPNTSFTYAGYEADDLLGIMARYLPEATIVSNDKDLLQIPGKHYDPQQDSTFIVTEEESRYWIYYQWIRGDSSDGYGGIKNFGQVKTNRFLEECDWRNKTFNQMAVLIYQLYAKHNAVKDYARNGILSRILSDVLGGQAIPWDAFIEAQTDSSIP